MKYELEIFDRIISGNLSPFADGLDDPLKFNKAIKEKNESCFNYIVGSFKKSGNKFVLLDKKVVSSLHPLVEKLITPQQNLFKVADLEIIAPDAYKILQLKKQNIVSVSYSRQPNKTVIFIKETRNCDEIPYNEAKYYYYNNLLKEEVLRIKKTIKESVFGYASSEDIEQYIHKQQHALINLCFQLMKVLDSEKQNDIYKPASSFTDIDILNNVFISLEELLRFFEKNYLKYIDGNIQIPYRSALVKIYEIDEKLEVVKSTLLNSEISPILLKCIYVPFLKLSAITIEERISYKELIYFNTYLTAFYDEIENSEQAITESRIKEILYEVNFNSIDFFNFEIQAIQLTSNQYDSISEKIDYYYHCLKTVNQRHCKLHIAFSPELNSLKQQLIFWIEEEISYLNKKIALNKPEQKVNLFSDIEKVKLQSGLTVAQLAFFFKLQADVGIISHKIQRDIFRHIAENYQTSKVVDISQDSIKNRYYNIDNSVIEVLKEKIIQILNQIKQH